MKGIERSIYIEGLNLERFLRQASEMNLSIDSIKRKGRRLTAKAPEDDLASLQLLAEQGGWRFSIGRRQGMGYIVDVLCARKLLAAMLIVMAVLLLLSTQIIWHIDVEEAGIYTADLQAYLLQRGIHPFITKYTVDLHVLRDALEWRYPDIAWADCGWRGGTLRIRLVQGTPVGEALTHHGSGDIIAERDGIVESIITLAGTDMVKPGDVVHQGQVLIQGMERTAEDALVPVMARGQVFSRVWKSASVRIPMHETQTDYTGRTQTCWTVTTPWFHLWKIPGKIYETEDIRRTETPLGGFFLPMVFITETHMETELQAVPRSEESVKTDAREAALRLLLENAGNRDDLVDKWVDCCMIDDEVIEAVATGEWIVDIGQPVRHEP